MIEGGLRSFIIAPILSSGGLVGTVSVHTFVQRDWTPQEVAEAQAAADLVAEQVVEERHELVLHPADNAGLLAGV